MTFLVEDSVQFSCNRRLSRAAFKLVKRLLQPRKQHLPVEVLLEQTNPATCFLHPSRNILRKDMNLLNDLATTVTVRTHPSTTFWPRPNQRSRSLYPCPHCSKTFASRYYLDVHLEGHHPTILPNNDSNNQVCPATAYCEALYGCEETALESEPYYGRGTGTGSGAEAMQIQQYYARHIPPCNDTYLQGQVQPRCRKLLLDCFSHVAEVDMVELHERICHKMTCANVLHQKLLPSHTQHDVHDWKEWWQYHHNQSVPSFLSFLCLLAVILSVLVYAVRLYYNGRTKQHRLLQSRRRQQPSWTSRIFSSARKKSLFEPKQKAH